MSFSFAKIIWKVLKFYGLYFCSIRSQNHVVFPVFGRSSQRKELVFAKPQECLGHGKKDRGSIKLRFVSENAKTHLMFHTLKRSLALLKMETAVKDDNLFRGALNRTLALITAEAKQKRKH